MYKLRDKKRPQRAKYLAPEYNVGPTSSFSSLWYRGFCHGTESGLFFFFLQTDIYIHCGHNWLCLNKKIKKKTEIRTEIDAVIESPLWLGKFTTKRLFRRYKGMNSLCLIQKKLFSVKLPIQARIHEFSWGEGGSNLPKKKDSGSTYWSLNMIYLQIVILLTLDDILFEL